MVVERSDIRGITVPTRNKVAVVVVAVVMEMDRTKTKETAIITVSRAILKPSVGRNILN